MGMANIAIIFGPLILGAGTHTKHGIPDVSGPALIVQTLLENTIDIFGEEGTSAGWIRRFVLNCKGNFVINNSNLES